MEATALTDPQPPQKNGRKKYVIEYDLPGKLNLDETEKQRRDPGLIVQLTAKFQTGLFRIIDSYIVYGTLDESDYYKGAEPSGSTVLILQADFMQAIYPDYEDFTDYMIEESLKLLQGGQLYVECYFKLEPLDADVFVLSLKA